MKTDRELLELAAKAAGMDAEAPAFCSDTEGLYLKGERTLDNDYFWNPLRRDGDALRLAVKLGIDVSFHEDAFCVYADCEMEPFTRTPDPYAATRRAIVRAAAAIQQSKEQ